MTHRAVICALTLGAFAAAPVHAQSVQQAQRTLWICTEKARNMQLEDDKKSEFIKKCVSDAERDRPAKDPT